MLAERTVRNLLDRYDELRAVATANPQRLGAVLRCQGRVVLAIEGLPPQVGHEILGVLRECLSGELLWARSLLSATLKDLAALIREVRPVLPLPLTAVVSDGLETLRKAVARTLPGIPHPWCHFHYVREAAQPLAEADRHAKTELTKRVRGGRPLARDAEARGALEGAIVLGYGAAVRASLTDDGRPPLSAAGLKRHARLPWILSSLAHVRGQLGGLPKPLAKLRGLVAKGLTETATWWPSIQAASRWVHRVARLLEKKKQLPAAQMRRGLSQMLTKRRHAAPQTQDEAVRRQLQHFVKVTKSYWPGLLRGYASIDMPRTNHDWEHWLGSYRYQERRARGRERPSASVVVKGAARVVSSLATRQHPDAGLALPEG